jgi:hypothetical protein
LFEALMRIFSKVTPIPAGLALGALLALSGCGHSDRGNDAGTPVNVEMPAENAMSALAPTDVPTADPSATAHAPLDPGQAAAERAASDAADIKAALDAANAAAGEPKKAQ